MAELNFPSSPTDGQTYTVGQVTWTYSESIGAWNITSSGGPGPIGPQGPTGFTGSQGIQGSTGFTGSIGFTGSMGQNVTITVYTDEGLFNAATAGPTDLLVLI